MPDNAHESQPFDSHLIRGKGRGWSRDYSSDECGVGGGLNEIGAKIAAGR